jgi:DNA-binding response OmpR family regulator
MIASPVAIVVDADLAELRKTERALEQVGFVVMGAGSFAQAKSLLVSITPEIVIADIKLEAFNGLHLAALCAVWRPATPFIATHNVHDTVLEADAKRLGASYVVKTPTREELTRTAVELLTSHRQGHEAIRKSHRKLAPTPTIVQIAASNAEVVDVSYGGVRLKLQSPPASRPPDERVPESFDIVFPDQAFSLRAARIWAAHDSQTGGWLCGVDVSQSDSQQLQRWREFVDSVV